MNTFKPEYESKLLTHPIIWVGLSGGLDSVVLLHMLSQDKQLHEKLKVIHVNHGLSPNAGAWQVFCQTLCQKWHIPFYSESLQLNLESNIEEQARNHRYAIFRHYVRDEDALVLAHHLDDQVETFLMNAIRGSGLKGLSSMPFYHQMKGFHLYRPLLDCSREAILNYAHLHDLQWIEDESNQSLEFTRNYLRHVVIPAIETKWPSYRHSILKTIQNCQQANQQLKINLDDYCDKHGKLVVSKLKNLDSMMLFEVFRSYFQINQLAPPSQKVFHQIQQQLLSFKRKDHEACVHCSYWRLYVYDDRLFLETKYKIYESQLWTSFPKDLYIDGLGSIHVSGLSEFDRTHEYEIRFRTGGEKILYRGCHHSLKKLFQDWRIPPFLRSSIPLLFINNQLKAVVGHIEADDINFKLTLNSI